MKKILLSLVIMFTCLANSACSKNEEPVMMQTDMVEVNQIMPETVSLNQETTFKVHITQGGKNVEDADDVQFEIWMADQTEKSEMIQAKHEKDGIFSINMVFNQEGMYVIQTHVTARDMHIMFKEEFNVGN